MKNKTPSPPIQSPPCKRKTENLNPPIQDQIPPSNPSTNTQPNNYSDYNLNWSDFEEDLTPNNLNSTPGKEKN